MFLQQLQMVITQAPILQNSFLAIHRLLNVRLPILKRVQLVTKLSRVTLRNNKKHYMLPFLMEIKGLNRSILK